MLQDTTTKIKQHLHDAHDFNPEQERLFEYFNRKAHEAEVELTRQVLSKYLGQEPTTEQLNRTFRTLSFTNPWDYKLFFGNIQLGIIRIRFDSEAFSVEFTPPSLTD